MSKIIECPKCGLNRSYDWWTYCPHCGYKYRLFKLRKIRRNKMAYVKFTKKNVKKYLNETIESRQAMIDAKGRKHFTYERNQGFVAALRVVKANLFDE